MFETNTTILRGGLADVSPKWNITGDILNEKLLRLYIPLTGEAVIRFHTKRVRLVVGNVYLFSSNTINDQFYKNSFEHFWIHFVPVSLRIRYLLIWKFVIQAWPVNQVAYTDELIEEMRTLVGVRKKRIADNPGKFIDWPVFLGNDAYQFKLQSYISRLIGDVLDKQSLTSSTHDIGLLDKLSPAITFMDAHYNDGPSLETIAETVFLTPWHFHKLFVKCFGISPHRYILLRRLSKARELLASTNLTINEISQKTGYRSNFYFSKVFKDEFGVSPRNFRKMEIL